MDLSSPDADFNAYSPDSGRYPFERGGLAEAGVVLKPPASVKEAPEVLGEQAKQLAAAPR